MIFEGDRDYDDDRAPGFAADLACLILLVANIIGWGGLLWLIAT